MEETLPREYPQKNQRDEAQDCRRYVIQIVRCYVLFAPPNVCYDNMKTHLTLLHTLHTGFSGVRVARSLASSKMF